MHLLRSTRLRRSCANALARRLEQLPVKGRILCHRNAIIINRNGRGCVVWTKYIEREEISDIRLTMISSLSINKVFIAVIVYIVSLSQLPACTAISVADIKEVTLAGNFQTSLGCSQDWMPSCPTTRLVMSDSGDSVWRKSFVLGAGVYEFKVISNT